jgi:tetratricopeptide (TPR) repeat protein
MGTYFKKSVCLLLVGRIQYTSNNEVKQKLPLLFLTYIVLAALPLLAQIHTIEELKQKLHIDNDTTKVETLYKIAYKYCNKGEFKEAINYINQSIKLAEALHYKYGCAAAYNNAGAIYNFQGNYPEALKNYLVALKYYQEINHQPGLVQCYTNIGIVFGEQKDYTKSLRYFNDALEIQKRLPRSLGLGDLYANLGSLYSEQGNINEALINDSLALDVYKKEGYEQESLTTYCNIGDNYLKLGNYEKALQYNFEALKLAEKFKNKNITIYALMNIGDVYLKQNKLKDATDYFNEGLSVANEIGSLFYIGEIYKRLSKIYSIQNDYKRAFDNYKKYILYRDSVYGEDNTKKLVTAEMQFDFDKKEAAAKAEQEVKDAVAKEEIQRQRVLKTAIASSAVVLILIILLFNNRRKAKHNLQVNKLENKTLRSQLNPHFIFNALASIQKYMDEHPDLAQNYLAKFAKLMREVLENSEKEYTSLEEEIAMLSKYMDLEKLRVTNGFDYDFIVDSTIDKETTQVPPLLFQPIIENAIWHGVANGTSKGTISITITQENYLLKIEIENDNKEQVISKKEEGQKQKSFGLQIVKERLALLSKEKRRKTNLEQLPTANGMKVVVEIPV